MSLWTQLCLLLGKNITLRKRQPVTILIEFIWPILLLLIISFIKRATPPVIKGPCYYQPLELPNGDFLSFMKSFVCMLDYKCYENSRSKDTVPYKNNLTPLYEIVTSGDNSYSVVSDLLENLKNALKDVNDLRNEPIIQKIQNGSISIIDFLNQTNQFKTKMRGYGVNDNITDAFLYSKIKIIEIYKVLNFSSKLKEKYLCNEADAVQFLRANDYFYLKNPNLTLVNNTNKTTLLSKGSNENIFKEKKTIDNNKIKKGFCGAGEPCLFLPEILSCLGGLCTIITTIILALIPCFIALIPVIINVLTIVLPIVLTNNNGNNSG